MAGQLIEEFRGDREQRTGGYVSAAFLLHIAALERTRNFRQAIVACADYLRELHISGSRQFDVLNETGSVGVRLAELLLKNGDAEAALQQADAIDVFLYAQRWVTTDLRERTRKVREQASQVGRPADR